MREKPDKPRQNKAAARSAAEMELMRQIKRIMDYAEAHDLRGSTSWEVTWLDGVPTNVNNNVKEHQAIKV